MRDGNSDEATRYLNEAILIDPCYVHALNNLGTLNFQHKKWDEALAFYNKAISCSPEFLEAYFNRANTYYELNSYFNAKQDVERKRMWQIAGLKGELVRGTDGNQARSNHEHRSDKCGGERFSFAVPVGMFAVCRRSGNNQSSRLRWGRGSPLRRQA